MTQPNVPEPNGYEAVVAELRRIADALETVPPGFGPEYSSFSIHAGRHGTAAAAVAVDAVAMAVLGKPGKTQRMSSGTYHHGADGPFTPINVKVFQQVPGPEASELELLRARVAELEAQRSFHQTAPDPTISPELGAFLGLASAAPAHFLEPGAGDGDLTDVLSCGLTVATSGDGGYVTDEAKVTCLACRAAAQLDHSQACRDQLEERPCRFDCEARS
jgi:hypothetical protein